MRVYAYLPIVGFLCLAAALSADPGTAFTYQGRLIDNATPVDGTVSLKFSLYDQDTTGTLVAGPLTRENTHSADGMIVQELDFGSVFDGTALWLEIEVDSDGGTDAFETLSPRVQLLPVPYAAAASTALDDLDRDPSNELQTLADVLAEGSDANGQSALGFERVAIAGPSLSGDFDSSQANTGLQVGVDSGLNSTTNPEASYGNIAIGNYQVFTSPDETGNNASATQALVVQAQDNPDIEGSYQLFSVQSRMDANRFSVVHGEDGYGSQFYDSLAVGAEGNTQLSSIDPTSGLDFGRDVEADLWVADDIEAGGTVTADAFVGDGTGLSGISVDDADADPDNEWDYTLPFACRLEASVESIQTGLDSTYTNAWQSFTAPRGGSIAALQARVSSPNETASFTFRIYEGEGTNGNLLDTSTYTGPTDADVWLSVPLTRPVPVTEGGIYTLRTTADSLLKWRMNITNPYPDGRADRGPSTDYLFRLYMSPPEPVAYLQPGAEAVGLFRLETNRPLQVGDDSTNGNGAYLTAGGTWTNASSRSLKEGFVAIDPVDVLERLVSLPVTRWEYTGSNDGEHLGPVAEDFYAAFGLGDTDKAISTTDADGVAFAAIKGVNAKLEAENEALRSRVSDLESRLEELEARINQDAAEP
ncbi:tail fiber domain-containing protein [bacterium]|nr:tail fiber domain-containing protein [bacterium]